MTRDLFSDLDAPDTPPASAERDKRLYLLDAMALAYRAHFSFISRPLINSKGLTTSAAFGFTNALVRLIQDHDMRHIAVVFDVMGPGGTFRDDLYDAYKAHRDPPPEELLANLPFIKEIVQAMDIPVIEQEGVEADDVIGTLARQAAEEETPVVIVSPDKDFQQLLGPYISIYKPSRRGEEFDPITADSFRESYDLEPIQFIDMLALMGDSADNVPGVPGIGEKTAMKLLHQYDSVENLLEHAADVKGKRAREGLLGHRDDALLSKKLVTIKTDLPVNLNWHQLLRAHPNMELLTSLFEELEFRTLSRKARSGELFAEAPAAPEPSAEHDPALSFDFGPYAEVKEMDLEAVDYGIVRNRQDLAQLAETLHGQDVLALDTETTSTDAMMASLVGLSFSWADGVARYVPSPLPDGTSERELLDVLRPVFENDALKVGQNLKYDLLVLARHGASVRGPLFDTMVAHYLLAPEAAHNLDAIAREHLSYRMQPITELIGTGKNQRSMRDVPIEAAGPYACEDADVTRQLYPLLRDALAAEGLTEIAETMEFPLIRVLVDMERHGIQVDTSILAEIGTQMEQDLADLQREIHEAAGTAFNINSPKQLGEVLFDTLGMRVVAKTSTGQPSTKESVLQELSTEHPLPGLILDWRSIAKLKSTYVDALGKLIHPETGRLHTDFNQTVTATGRLSSSNPNLQNIPVRTARGREIRRAFVPAEGHRLLAADYVQIELRILASMSGDEALAEAFRSGQDIHTAAAARVFDVEPDAVSRDQRRKAKEVNYGIPYGVSAFGLAQRLRSEISEAQALIDQYQKSYPRVSTYLAEQVEHAKEHGHVETLLGRRRFVPGIQARNRNERSAAERIAVNMPIQGTQADMIKIAMVRIHDRLTREGLQSRMLLQVHDELVFEVVPEEADAVCALVEAEMVGALPLKVPVTVDLNVAGNWLDAH
ncbi:MAG: DNA polymerase I [Bacteroidota bacterium]